MANVKYSQNNFARLNKSHDYIDPVYSFPKCDKVDIFFTNSFGLISLLYRSFFHETASP